MACHDVAEAQVLRQPSDLSHGSQAVMQSRPSPALRHPKCIIAMHPRLRATQPSITATTMLGTAFLCGALALIVALHSQSGFRLGDLVASHLYNHRCRPRRTATRSRAKISPSQSHPRPKCFTHVECSVQLETAVHHS